MKAAELLKSIDIFAQLSEDDLHRVAALLKENWVGRDTVLFHQGEAGDALHILLSGRVKQFTVDPAGRERVLGFFSEGHSFGEMALLTGEHYPITAQTVTDAKLLVLRKGDFDAFLAHNVQVMLQVMKVVAQRQATTNPHPPREQEREAAPPTGEVYTLFSPKGGVGKSTLAVNLAVALARAHPDRVALLDLSLTFGHVPVLLNLSPKTSLSAISADALARMDLPEELAYYLSVHSSSLRVLAGALRPEEGETVSGEMAAAAIRQLRRHFDYLVVDTGCFFSDPMLAALEAADKILMVCSPEIAILQDLRECQRILNDVVRVPRDRILYLLNLVYPFKLLSREQLEGALQQELFAELPYAGDVAAKAALRGEAFVETQSGSALAKSIQKLAAQLTAERAKVGAVAGAHQERKRGFFR